MKSIAKVHRTLAVSLRWHVVKGNLIIYKTLKHNTDIESLMIQFCINDSHHYFTVQYFICVQLTIFCEPPITDDLRSWPALCLAEIMVAGRKTKCLFLELRLFTILVSFNPRPVRGRG